MKLRNLMKKLVWYESGTVTATTSVVKGQSEKKYRHCILDTGGWIDDNVFNLTKLGNSVYDEILKRNLIEIRRFPWDPELTGAKTVYNYMTLYFAGRKVRERFDLETEAMRSVVQNEVK